MHPADRRSPASRDDVSAIASLAKDRQILVVRARHLGDFNNALGIASALAERSNASVKVIEPVLRANVLIPLVRLTIALGRAARQRLAWQMAQVLFRGYAPDVENVACVVSTLGRGEPAGALIAALHNTISVHLGTPKRLPRRFFDVVIAHQGMAPLPGEISLPISPTRQRLSRSPKDALVIALGGNAEGVKYEQEFWRRFIESSINLAMRENLTPLATTSPRTSEAAARELQEQWRARNLPNTDLQPYRPDSAAFSSLISRARVFCVSAESVSMISDGIAAGAKTVAAHWGELPKSDRISHFIRTQVSAGRIGLWDIADGTMPSIGDIRPLEICWSEIFWGQLPKFVQYRLTAV